MDVFQKIDLLIYNEFFVGLILTIVIGVSLSVIYKNFSLALSNKQNLSFNLILLALITYLIISSIKSSIALSLGMVGALSIVRFRVAIKEPEEVVYIFFAIAIAIANAAGIFLQSVISSIIIFIIIIISNKLKFKFINTGSDYLLIFNDIENYKKYDHLINLLKKERLNFIILNYEILGQKISANIKIKFINQNQIENLKKSIINFDKNLNYSFFNNDNTKNLDQD